MPFRFNAAAGARGARGLARQASRRLSLLAYTGDMSAPVAARGGGLGRPSPAPASSAAAAARARTKGRRRIGRDAAIAAAPPQTQVGWARRFTSPAAAPPTAAIDLCGCSDGRRQSTSTFAMALNHAGANGGRRRRGLATTPATASTEHAAEDAGGGDGFGGVVSSAADNNAGGEQKHVARRTETTAEAVHGAGEPAPAGDGGAGTNGGGGGGDASGVDTATASESSSGIWRSLAESNEELRKHAMRGEGDEAVALIARMRQAGVTPTDRSYTSAINACKKGEEAQWEQALALLRETATVGGGVTPNAYHYTAAIKTCGSAHQWGQVLSLKAEMDSLGITPGLPYFHWMIKWVAVVKPEDARDANETGAGPPSSWEAVRDLVEEMSAKAVVPNQNTFALVRQAKSRITPRGGDDGDDGDGGDGGGGAVDAELAWAFGVLRGIDGAPEPWARPALTTRKPEWRPAKSKQKKPAAAAAAGGDASESGSGSSSGSISSDGVGGKPKVRERHPSSPPSTITTTASAPSTGDDQQPPGPAAAAAATAIPAGSIGKYNKELRELAKVGEGDKAAALIARMREEAGTAPTVRSYTSAINACKNGKVPQWEQALALVREAATVDGGAGPNAYHYTAAIKTCGYAGRWNQIPALISEMEARGVRPDAALYNWAIKATLSPRTGQAMRAILAREGGWQAPPGQRKGGGGQSKSPSFGWEAATGLLRDMSARGVPPTSITYTLVMWACQKDREPERALAVLREMQELAAAAAAAAATATSKTSASPNEGDGQAETEKDSAAAAAAAAGVEEEGGSSGAGLDDSGAVVGGGSCGSSDSSGNVDSRRRRRRPRIVTPNVFHYSTVMSAFAEQTGGWKRILALIKEMEAAGVAPNAYTYNSAITACGRDGRWAEAVAVFRRMLKKGVVPDEVSFLAVIEACRQGEQWALAVALLREMSTTPIPVEHKAGAGASTTTTVMMSPTIEAYTAALTACGNAGQWEVAVGLLREVTDGDAMAATAAAAVNDGADVEADADAAAELDEDGEGDSGAGGEGKGRGSSRPRKYGGTAAAETIPVPLRPDLLLYNAAIEACGNAGQWQRALKLLSEISEIGLSPSVVSYNSTIAACARADQWEKAVALLDEMRVLGLIPVSSTFLPAIEACQRAGEGKLAYALTKERDETQRRMKKHPEFRSMKRGQRKGKTV